MEITVEEEVKNKLAAIVWRLIAYNNGKFIRRNETLERILGILISPTLSLRYDYTERNFHWNRKLNLSHFVKQRYISFMNSSNVKLLIRVNSYRSMFFIYKSFDKSTFISRLINYLVNNILLHHPLLMKQQFYRTGYACG